MSKKMKIRPEPEILALPFTGADSHVHLTSPELFDRVPFLIEKAMRCGVKSFGNVFLGFQEYQKYKEIFENFPQVFFLMGIHPCDAMNCTSQIFVSMYNAFEADSRLKAVGEIGLDFYWKDCPKVIQEEVFRLQLDLAKKVKRPVVIHSRDAAEDTLRILESEDFINYPVVWHCFSGDAVFVMDRILENGWSLSIAGLISYPANTALRDAIQRVPEDRLLLETDSPYLAPVPWRGKCNEPALIVFTAEVVADVRGVEVSELWTQCGDNTRKIFMHAS